MTILENFKILQQVGEYEKLLKKLGFHEAKLSPNDLSNFYFENTKEIYNFLPVYTHEVLQNYFENEKNIPNEEVLMFCTDELQNFGIAKLEADDIYIISSINGLIDEDDEDEEGHTSYKGERDFIPYEFDDKFARLLFNYLNENEELIDYEFELRRVISGILNEHMILPLKEMTTILNKLNFKIDENYLYRFLNFKVGIGVFNMFLDESSEKTIVQIIGRGISPSENKDYLNFDANKFNYSVDYYVGRGTHF
ncbi:hypothetical protein [Cetobacterium sp.]|uniref:hypothetical protein n=1 Tax=Cetobacterium sp. TaxID=2071632 RepID=UPI003F3B824D